MRERTLYLSISRSKKSSGAGVKEEMKVGAIGMCTTFE